MKNDPIFQGVGVRTKHTHSTFKWTTIAPMKAGEMFEWQPSKKKQANKRKKGKR
jgi:hypothetical protein